MTSPPYLLGIDLGTTTCRCALFDRAGREVASARRETSVSFPRPLWAESDPEQWWRCVVAVLGETLARVRPEQVAAVGLCGLMHAPVLLDEGDRPLAPAMLWMDQRCAPQAAAMNAEAAADHEPSPRPRPLSPWERERVRAAREPGRPGDQVRRPFATTVSAPKLRWLAEE